MHDPTSSFNTEPCVRVYYHSDKLHALDVQTTDIDLAVDSVARHIAGLGAPVNVTERRMVQRRRRAILAVVPEVAA